MRKQWLIVILSAAVVTGLYFLGLPIQRIAGRVLDPIGGNLSNFGQSIGTKFSELRRLGSYAVQNDRLREENLELQIALVNQELLQEENRQLRSQLGFTKTTNHKLLGADIINFQPDANRDKVRINKGSADGLKPRMAAVYQGVLIGVVDRVAEKSAEVLLAGDLNFRAVVETKGHKATGIIKGEIGESVVMERIPNGQSIKPGDLVVTSGKDGIFPPGFLVGNVISINEVDGSVFKSAQLKPSLNPRDLKILMVVIE